jgi:phage FluMu protein Com
MVATERTGISPKGDVWVADVFCEKGASKVAFEVQMSPQTKDETVRRQFQYKESGVRTAWFYGSKLHGHLEFLDRNVPVFSLSNFVAGEEPLVEKFNLPLSKFVNALLNKQLVWARSDTVSPFYLAYFQHRCSKCKRLSKLIYQYAELSENLLSKSLGSQVRADQISAALARLITVITNQELMCLGFAQIVVIYGNAGIRYVNQNCPKCMSIFENDSLANCVNKIANSQTFDVVNEDGEVIDHPIGVELINRTEDECGYWMLRDLA